MSDKKSLLSESEIRRFMTLANIPVVGGGAKTINESSPAQRYAEGEAGLTMRGSVLQSETAELDEMGGSVYEEDPVPDEMGAGDEMAAGEMPELEDGGDKEERFKEAIETLAELAGIELETETGEGGGEMEPAPEEEEEEEEEPAEEPEEEEEGEEGEGEEQQELQESRLIDTVLARVSARLISEAKKKKDEKKKKMSAAEKMKAMKAAKEKKKKLEEANAPAPKSTMSNASAAGVAKGAGKADKGTFGVTSTLRKNDKFVQGANKTGDKMEDVSASAEHMVSHGKKNLATMGSNKKK